MDLLDLQSSLESIAHDLDMLVFSLETSKQEDVQSLKSEQARLRRELERLHERLTDLVRSGRFS